MTVTVILQASRAKDQSEGREALRQEAVAIERAVENREIQKAKAKLVYFDADEKSHSEEVDFAKQKVTAKRNIPTTAEDGSPIRNEAAVREILAVALDNDDELRAIVEAN